jgi:hypothetical protein
MSSFVIVFGLFTWANARFAYIVNSLVLPEVDNVAVTNELWMRLVIPPSLQWDCYTDKMAVCRAADTVVSFGAVDFGWESYWKNIRSGLGAGLISGMLAWYFTRGRAR